MIVVLLVVLYSGAITGLYLISPETYKAIFHPFPDQPAKANNLLDAEEVCESAVKNRFPSERYSSLLAAKEHSNGFEITYRFRAVNPFGITVTYQTTCKAFTDESGKITQVYGGDPAPVVD